MRSILLFVFGLCSHLQLFAQCSDAGICAIGTDNHSKDLNDKYRFDMKYKYGYSGKTDSVSFHSVNVALSYQIFEYLTLDITVPYNVQSGPLGTVQSNGDPIILLGTMLYSDRSRKMQGQIGGRFTLGNDNEKNLPQVYQSSLGSNDLLLGINASNNSWIASIGYQVAGKRNTNITQLKRGDELFAKIGYLYETSAELSFTPSLIFIHQVGESSVVSKEQSTTISSVNGSAQSQLNLSLNARYELSKTTALASQFAMPFLKREVNVDGLTRVVSLSIGLELRM
jgi:hypothetical protein